RPEGRWHPVHRFQIRGKLGADAADPRAGRHIRRFDQTMERSMSRVIVTPKAPAKEVLKDASMQKQKDMMAGHYDRLTSAPKTGAKVASTFVPGNLNELIMCFDLVNNLPEVNAIQSGLRRQSGGYV